jgi:hypothetical protein
MRRLGSRAAPVESDSEQAPLDVEDQLPRDPVVRATRKPGKKDAVSALNSVDASSVSVRVPSVEPQEEPPAQYQTSVKSGGIGWFKIGDQWVHIGCTSQDPRVFQRLYAAHKQLGKLDLLTRDRMVSNGTFVSIEDCKRMNWDPIQKFVTAPKKSVTAPKKSVTAPKKSVTAPKKSVTASESVTLPVRNQIPVSKSWLLKRSNNGVEEFVHLVRWKHIVSCDGIKIVCFCFFSLVSGCYCLFTFEISFRNTEQPSQPETGSVRESGLS